jgi:hypothetical protein
MLLAYCILISCSLHVDQVRNTRTVNRTGQPTGYKLIPGSNCLPFCLPEAKFLRRAGFLKHNLWVTSYKKDEIFPGGDFPNQNPRIHEGLATWVQKDRSLEETNIVLWYVFVAACQLVFDLQVHFGLQRLSAASHKIVYIGGLQVRFRDHPYPKARRLACHASGTQRLHAHGSAPAFRPCCIFLFIMVSR